MLVLYDNNRLLPANIDADRGLSDAVASSGRNVDLSAEFLDYPRFGGEGHIRTVTTYLREKYASQPPDVIVVGGNGALDFLVRNRTLLFPNVPVIHMGVDKAFADAMKLPANFAGVPVEVDMIGTIKQALRWHPRATHLVVVTGASAPDREWESDLRTQLIPLQKQLSIEFLAGLPTPELQKRVGSLGLDTVIFTPGYFTDGDGRSFAPREAARAIATAASAPVYGPFNTFIGVGVVGGRVSNFEAMGRMAGGIVNQVLDGHKLSEIAFPKLMPTTLSIDWRQIERWGIAQGDIPSDAEVHFRTPGLWEQYKSLALLIAAAFLVQTALLGGLLFERRRRRTAENAVDKHRFELAHASRLAIAGELTASIAHEINQPLGAILSNVAAADLILESNSGQQEELRQILADIRRDDLRASEVIKRLRTLLEKHQVNKLAINLNEAIADTELILRAQALSRKVDLSVLQSSNEVTITADKVQIQQILINLVLNAMDAVSGMPENHRIVTLSVAHEAGTASIRVCDTGHGIPIGQEAQLFESFFTTKGSGIGLGLSIVRTLVQAHGGKVWAQNRSTGGATFYVELPAG
ncbi:two-component sensor histidine kinase [Labrys miyagiensis]|uniref:histidine kinase n=1 Tax=Labrys miyagiensis TaxID=346912 RepID=A0ABQ6CU88_9HYPH|nr:two-component sensor histidine kinase [Labrys miyagiensis]